MLTLQDLAFMMVLKSIGIKTSIVLAIVLLRSLSLCLLNIGDTISLIYNSLLVSVVCSKIFSLNSPSCIYF